MFCGYSQNEIYRVGELNASIIIPWAQMYRYVRVKKIHVKYVHKRSSQVIGYTAGISTAVTVGDALNENYEVPQQTAVRSGGDMVFMCTSRTGPVPEEAVTDAQITSGDWIHASGYSLIRRDPRLRKKAVFRNDVAFGMRPVKFSFSPTCVVATNRGMQVPMLGNTDTAPTFYQGLVSRQLTGQDSINPSTSSRYVFRKAGWWPMVMPQLGPSSAIANGGRASYAPPGIAGQGLVIYSDGTYNRDEVGRWMLAPMFGMYMGLQPTTAAVWPHNLIKQISYELEFKGLRNMGTVNDTGQPVNYFKDWGLIPTARLT